MPNDVIFRPSNGGMLMSALSADSAGLANYTIKRDWRRNLDSEVLSEGYDWFCPNPAKFSQPAANGEAITLVALARRNNRQTAVVVGTATALFRYYGLDNGAYCYGLGTPDAYGFPGPDGYFDLNDGAWMQIGSGFAANAQRWQAVGINGYLVLNNGVDLPMTYRLEESKVKPIYELRELGIASVGCIAEHNGVLQLGNIRTLKAEAHEQLMATKPSAVNVGQVGVTRHAGLATVNNDVLTCDTNLTVQAGDVIRMANGVTRTVTEVTSATTATLEYPGSVAPPVTVEPAQPFYILTATRKELNKTAAQMFPSTETWRLVGKLLYWDTGEVRRIDSVALDGKITVDSDLPIVEGPCSIENPLAYAAFTDKSNIEYFPWRHMWSMPSQPRRFGSIITGTLAPGSDTVVMDYPAKSLELGKEYIITGAGPDGNNATLKLVALSGRLARFEGTTLSSVPRTESLDVLFQAADAEASITGLYEDHIHDGSAILAMLSLRTLLVIYKETSIILGKYTGVLLKPFDFEEPIVLPEGTGLGYPHTLINVGEAHYYAGANNTFFVFDLTGRFPREMEVMKPCQDVFYAGLPEYVLGKELRPSNTFQSPEMTIEGLDPSGRYLFVDGGVQTETGPQLVDASGAGRYIVYGQPPEPATFSFRQILDVRQHVYAAHNPLTKEVWFCFPSTTEDSVLRWDYALGTVSTSSLRPTAAGAVAKPSLSPWLEDWFIMGNETGEVMRYGLVAGDAKPSGAVTASKTAESAVVTATGPMFYSNSVGKSILLADHRLFAIIGFIDARRVTVLGDGEFSGQKFSILPAIYHRAGQPYTAVLQSGVESFGVPDKEKSLDQYTLFLADDSPSALMKVFFRGALNPTDAADVLSTDIELPQKTNMVPAWMEAYFLGERIEVSGVNHFVKLTGRSWAVIGINTHSFSRRLNAS